MNPIFRAQMNCSKVLKELAAESPWLPSVITKGMLEKSEYDADFKMFQKVLSTHQSMVIFSF